MDGKSQDKNKKVNKRREMILIPVRERQYIEG